MEMGNSRTVYVVQLDNNKDLSDAKRYGNMRAVLGKPRKPYNTTSLMAKARHVLKDWKPGDYLLMIGDPTLCGLCLAVASERDNLINVLSWDRDTFQYIPQTWDFSHIVNEYEDFDAADD